MSNEKQYSPTREDFEALLKEIHKDEEKFEGRVVRGTVISIGADFALVDVGLKSEGRIPLHEFGAPGVKTEVKEGDTIDVFVERLENAQGEAMLSRERARREEAWELLEKSYNDEAVVEGVIFGRVKGGFTVDLSGAVAFLPGSQLDVRPLRDMNSLMNVPLNFQILKMDRKRGNIVVSRRALLEEERAEQRAELMANMEEGQVLPGIVKNITEYGAFVDLGGVDGLLHLTDMAWSRMGHPSEIMKIGDTIDVKIIRINPETQRISLGIKQLLDDPWEDVVKKFPLKTKVKGVVTNITDYGAFIELGNGIEGLVHVSEMSWTKKNIHPGKMVSTSQEVEVMVLEIDPEKRRISLGLKQCTDNPWDSFSKDFKVGSKVEGTVKNITEFGLFIGINDDLDGMVHLSDLDWNRSGDQAIAEYKKGDMVKAIILDINSEKERISLGIKQLGGDPFSVFAKTKKGEVITGTVSQVNNGGVELAIGDTGLHGFIRKNDLSRDRNDQRPDRFAVGEKVDAMVTNVDKSNRKVSLSIKALEIREEKQAVAQYGSSDSGASLGDILGAALKESKTTAKPAKKETKAKKAAKAPETKAATSKKVAPKKGEAKKAPAKKAAPKKGEAKKTPAKKAAPKKEAAGKKEPKKAPAKKTAPKKEAAAKKAPAKKAAKKTGAKKESKKK
ncbi:MAG: 30S ribosomal protein S1 [Alphaproteobacteria bacterium]|nr:MAG: 30S ribosomal protein S1 [Alphaproteobacteria bacterium]